MASIGKDCAEALTQSIADTLGLVPVSYQVAA